MRFWVVASVLFLSLYSPAWAQPAAVNTATMPTYDSYLQQCLLSASKKAKSDAHLAGAGLVCQCSYERLESLPRISRPQLSQALDGCSKELVTNPQSFMAEYADRLREGLRRARGL